MIYEPREDSFLLQKYVRKYAKGKVLDLGSGSGIQALTALQNTKDVLALDIDEESVQELKKKGIKAVKSDLFENIKDKFDLIIFNPPYLPRLEGEGKELSKAISGGKNGYELIERFLKQVKRHLKDKGRILIVFSSLTGNIEELFKRYNYKFKKLEEQVFFYEKIFIYELSEKFIN